VEGAQQPETLPVKKSRKKLAAIVIVIAIAGVAAAGSVVFYLNQPGPSCRPPTSGDVIKIGFSISLQGRYNVEGTASRNGINTAVQWVNEHGGVTVQGKRYNLTTVYYDDKSEQSDIGPLYTRIVQQDAPQFLLAPYSSALAGAAAPIADQFNCVMLSHGGSSDTIFNRGYRNLVAVLSPASAYLRTAVDWLKANHPTDRIAALYEGDPFSSIAGPAAVDYARSLQLDVVYNESYPTGTVDMTPKLTAAKNAGADVLIGGGHYADGNLIMTQLGQVGWTPKLVSLLVAVTEPKFNTELGGRANNVTGPSQWEAAVAYSPALASSRGLTWDGPTPAEFVSLYGTVTSGQSPSYHAAEAAAAVIVLAAAIERANGLGTAAVRQALGDMTLMTFFGEYDVDANGLQTAHDMVLIQWQNGTLKVVAPTEVREQPLRYPYTGS
jgi:branched-chain amino acid transport system substrate-binding protein